MANKKEEKKLLVLKDCQFLLYALGMGDESLWVNDTSITSNRSLYTICHFSVKLYLVQNLCYFFELGSSLDRIAYPISILIITLQSESIFMCMLKKKNVIANAIPQLQFLVDQSILIFK